MKAYKKIFFLSAIITAMIGSTLSMNSCVHQPAISPDSTGASSICFERDILPIFQSNCARSGCHDAVSREGGYNLTSYANIMRRGIVAGSASSSRIYKSLLASGEDRMPRDAPALSTANISLIRTWIQGGAHDSGACYGGCDTNSFSYSATIAPLMQTYCTGCHNSASAPGGSLMDYTSVKNATLNGMLIPMVSHTAGYDPMPQNGNMLLDCQITQIKKWAAAGAPNN